MQKYINAVVPYGLVPEEDMGRYPFAPDEAGDRLDNQAALDGPDRDWRPKAKSECAGVSRTVRDRRRWLG